MQKTQMQAAKKMLFGGQEMKIILIYNDYTVGEQQADMIKEWIGEIMADKSTENKSPLRYADEVRIEE